MGLLAVVCLIIVVQALIEELTQSDDASDT
jgi:hypothetical protein